MAFAQRLKDLQGKRIIAITWVLLGKVIACAGLCAKEAKTFLYLNGVSKCDRTKQNENIPLSSIDFQLFLLQV